MANEHLNPEIELPKYSIERSAEYLAKPFIEPEALPMQSKIEEALGTSLTPRSPEYFGVSSAEFHIGVVKGALNRLETIREAQLVMGSPLKSVRPAAQGWVDNLN